MKYPMGSIFPEKGVLKKSPPPPRHPILTAVVGEGCKARFLGLLSGETLRHDTPVTVVAQDLGFLSYLVAYTEVCSAHEQIKRKYVVKEGFARKRNRTNTHN